MTSQLSSLGGLASLRRTAVDIQTLFSSRTALPVIAARDLQRALRAQFPEAVVTDATPVLLTPRYHCVDQNVVQGVSDRSSLVDQLIKRFVEDAWVDYTQGQLLTEQPDAGPIKPSGIKLLDAQTAVNERGAQLLQTCRQALIDDWIALTETASNRFELLSGLLKDGLKRLADHTYMTTVQRQMIEDVVLAPDNNLRTTMTRAYLVDQWGVSGSQKLELLRGMVLANPQTAGDALLLFSLGRGIEVFDSPADLGAGLRKRLTGLAPGQAMQWRLYEPRSNMFDQLALTFLIKQLDDLQVGFERGRVTAYWGGPMLAYIHWLVTGDFDTLHLDPDSELSKLYAALPTWLQNASRETCQLYSQYLQAMGSLFGLPTWKPFDEGVPSLLDYARQQVLAAYPQASRVDPEDVIITVHTVRGASAAGGFPVKTITTLLRVALENLQALPGDSINVTLRDGSRAPAWMTGAAIKALVTQVDIGQNYPKLAAVKLKDTPAEVQWRSRHFIQQLRLELPMLALEFYSRGLHGFSRLGHATVAAVLKAAPAERYVGAEAIVLRPLAFKASATATADIVINMFVFGPKHIGRGPVVLYSPMGEPKLREFASHQALLAAIAEAGVLQQQVLAWMTPDARATYQGQGFNAPRFNSIDGLALLIDALTSLPAALGTDEISDDYAAHLYDSQVRAVLEQAQEQSVSNQENLWARRMEGLSLGLNSVMPFVTGPLAVVGWLLVAWGVHEQIAALRSGDQQARAPLLAGFFLNMALVLMHYSADPVSAARPPDDDAEGRAPTPEAPGAKVGPDSALVPQSSIVQLPSMEAGLDKAVTELPVEYSWTTSSARLTASLLADLKTFAVTRPAAASRVKEGVGAGLYQHKDRWYAEVDGDEFLVQVQPHAARVVSASGRLGPWLKSDASGRWTLDLTLRLRGGAPGEARTADTAHALRQRFDALHDEFRAAQLPDHAEIERVGNEGGFEKRLLGLDRENHKIAVYRQRVSVLLDLLQQRTRVEVVAEYAWLRSRFLASKVRALRLQIGVMSVRRRTLYQQAMSDPARVYTLSLQDVALTKPTATYRLLLYQVAGVHMRAIVLCREQLESFEALLQAVVAGDTQTAVLDVPEWSGQAKSLAWKEAGLRPMFLRCLRERARAPGMDALYMLIDTNLRCRLRLSSYRRLCEDATFASAVRLRVLNEAIDEFAWLDTRLQQVATIPAEFIDLITLAELREYLRKLRVELIQDALKYYGQPGSQAGAALGKSLAGRPVRMVQSSRFGTLVGSRGADNDHINFVDPYTGLVYASFEKSRLENDWQHLAVAGPSRPAQWQTRHYINSQRLIRQAENMLLRLPALEANSRLSSRAVRGELEQMAETLFEDVRLTTAEREHALGRDPLHERLVEIMNEKANNLIAVARQAQQRMILARAPDVMGVEDLVAEGVVEIKEVPGTHRSPGSGTPPLFRSFYIQKVRADSAQAPEILWFAHFHYAPGQTDALSFTSAHLKPYDSPYESFGHQLRTARGDNERLLKVYRATIDRAAAQRLFFNDQTVAAQ
ncbi:dermonecrotic toxin domain-containing protein [Pseudomonas sp.]|uniref:dermonecrotic toxin domain-containing protein n=1 Tax=Pseudomonas sp. TaxID=306 RepID=UPI003C3F95EF